MSKPGLMTTSEILAMVKKLEEKKIPPLSCKCIPYTMANGGRAMLTNDACKEHSDQENVIK